MRIRTLYKDKETVYERSGWTFLIGRSRSGAPVDIDLTPDELTSRTHAKISFHDGQWWIEDLGSRRGTRVDGQQIRGRGEILLSSHSSIRVGATVVWVEPNTPTSAASTQSDSKATCDNDAARSKGAPARPTEPAESDRASEEPAPALKIARAVRATEPVDLPAPVVINASAFGQLRKLYDLLLRFGADEPLDEVLQFALEDLVSLIPAADRGAVLVSQTGSDKLLLKAHVPSGQPAISETLADRAIRRGEGFIWERAKELTVSQKEFRLASGMYAPMTWKGETFGVIGVDNSANSGRFENDDLQLLVAAAQHAALALANHRLREALQSNAALTDRLLTNFSPAVRRQLLAKARSGRLRLGGVKSEVTILSSDIRGFTRLTSNMEAEDIVDMLNDYFSALVDAIFRHRGTVDKFIGDAILAVFGSPEHDPDHHANAVRAAVAMQTALASVNAIRTKRGQVVCEMGIGVHCGSVLHGFIGSEDRMEFTVIGDAVNRAARFCDGAIAGQVLISPEVHQRVWKLIRTEKVTIPTKHEGDLNAFRVVEYKDDK